MLRLTAYHSVPGRADSSRAGSWSTIRRFSPCECGLVTVPAGLDADHELRDGLNSPSERSRIDMTDHEILLSIMFNDVQARLEYY